MKLFKKMLTISTILVFLPTLMRTGSAMALTGTINTQECFQYVNIENTARHNITYIELNSNRLQNYFIWGTQTPPELASASYNISNDAFTEAGDLISTKIESGNFKLSRGEPFVFCENNKTIIFKTAGTADNPTLVRRH